MSPQNAHIDEAVLLSYLLNELDGPERERIEKWLDKSPENRKELKKLRSLWKHTESVFPGTADIDAAWDKMEKRITENQQDKKKTTIRPLFNKTILAVAASVLIVLASWFVFKQISPEQINIQTAQSEILTDTLPDGSIVTLNEKTRLSYNSSFGKSKRQVKLDGEAFFDITKNPDKKFIINTFHSEVAVLGTKFNLNARENEAVVLSVVEGTVSIASAQKASNKIIVNPGQTAVIPKGTDKPLITSKTSDDSRFWINKSLVFRNASLSDVFQKLEKLYGINIKCQNTEILNYKLNARFEHNTAAEILEIVSMTFNLKLIKFPENQFEIGLPKNESN